MRPPIILLFTTLLTLCATAAWGKTDTDTVPESLVASSDTLETDTVVYRNDDEWDLTFAEDSLYLQSTPIDTADAGLKIDSLALKLPKMRQLHFTPDPIRAMWLGLVFPGGGQIYNRKFWKLPIFYGGFLGCAYAFSWNSQMLKDYSQAYLDITDNDPTTQSYMKMLPLNYNISGKEERFKDIFKRKKNTFRKYRDMSIFAFVGVYLLSVIDAYVDAELSTFDISRDLSLHWAPTTINNDSPLTRRFAAPAYGVQCALEF